MRNTRPRQNCALLTRGPRSSLACLIAMILFGATSVFAQDGPGAPGQLQWSSYDTSGNLVTANVATGGDLASGTSVTFSIPANTTLLFVTKNFTPFSIAGANARKLVNFNINVSAGLGGVTQRVMGWGLYNSAGTATLTDDIGYFGLWNGGGPYLETYDQPGGSANLMSGTKLNQGTANTGTPSDGATYTNQIQLVMNSTATGISLGTSSSTLANAGLAMNGVNVVERVYTNPVIGPLGNVTSFDEFAFMFDNTTGSPVTVTLNSLTLGNSLTWDASAANPAAPTDGGGNWSATNANWSSVGSDTVWSSGYSAVFGANNGAAGIITNLNGVVVSNLTFNPAGSGSYNITNSTIVLAGPSTITVASGVSATINSSLGGTGFTKVGNGTLVLLPSTAATNVGATVVNAGTLSFASSGVNGLNDDLIVNPGATALFAAGAGIPLANKLVINGATVTNLSTANTTVNQNQMVFDNNGVLVASAISQLNVTNFDFRSGLEAFPKWPSTMTTNFSVKSTPGTMIVQSRANSSGANGIAGLKINAGTFICDYANPAPNNDTQGGAKYVNTAQMSLAGGTLFQRFNATANRTETVGGVAVLSGATSVQVTNNSSGNNNYTFAQGAITRAVGGTVDYSVGGTSSGTKTCTTTTANANGILGGYATYGGSDWAAGTTIAPYAGYFNNPDPTTWATTNNVNLVANPSANIPDLTIINTLRLPGTSALTLNGSLTLAGGGLLVTGAGSSSISGGTLMGASGGDLIFQDYGSSAFTVSSTLADNGAATSLTKSGSGKLVIAGTDTMTGSNFLNGGTLEVSSLAQLASGPLVMNNGTLRYTGSDVTSTRAITLNGVGGTFDIAGSATVTQSTAILGGGGFNSTLLPGLNLGDWGGLTKLGPGTLVLSANNTYNGPTVVSNGVLIINGTNSLTGTSGLTNYSGGGSVTVYSGATLGGTGVIAGALDIKAGGTLSPGVNIGTLTVGAGLTLENGSTSIFEEENGSNGDLLQIQGNLTIQPNSTIAINIAGGALNAATNVLITYTGTKTGSFNPTVALLGGSLNSSLFIDESIPGQIRLVAAPQVAITSQPQNAIASTNDPVSFSVTATGTAPLAYQWYFTPNISTPASPIDSATNSLYSIGSADGTNNGLYFVVVTNNYNAVTSSTASLIVGNLCTELSGPTDQSVIQGNNATFTGTVVLANPLPTFQWQTNSVDVTGATNASLTLNNVQFALNGTVVSLIASNVACLVTNSATLTVTVPPVITPQPTNVTVNVGDTAVFASGATGVPAPGYQWYKNNVAISGANSSTLTINNAQGSDIASYKLVATNSAGSATSTIVTLTVNSTTLASTAVGPVNGATAVCYDTPLYLTLNAPVTIVNSGKIRIYNATNTATPVDTIDMSSNSVVVSSGINLTNNIQPHSLFSGDSQVINYYPVIINGNLVAIYPHGGVMTSNQTYYVTLDNGIVKDSTGAYFAGISDTNAWRFTTKPTGPANRTNIVVAADGSGDFVTVQGAVDSVPSGNANYTLVNIQNGNYVEIVDISGKNNITFRGQSRTGTLVGYPNNNNLTGTTAARMALKVNAADIKFENLTITNGTPQGGSQAEALLVYNNGLRCVVNNCDIVSRQDTILINASTSQAYFYNCRVVGNFDYIWGSGVGYFDHCVFHTITNTLSGSYNLTAARTLTSSSLSAATPWVNPNGTTYSADGFTFVNCTLEADNGLSGITLAGSNGTAGGLDAWLFCAISAAYVPSSTLSNTYVFWQYSDTDTNGNPISLANVQTIGITNNDPRLLAATNPPTWFSGWTPLMAPNILTNPADQSVPGSGTISLSVVATGIPSPSYQWYQNGNLLSGQTGASLVIASANVTNAGAYSVVVSNAAGVATSSTANVTVGNTAPTLAPIPNYTNNVGVMVSVTPSASDPDSPPQTLSFSLLSGPSTTFDTTTGAYTWRPQVADSGTLNTIQIVVTDNGSPNLSATQTFIVAVNPLTQPTISAPSVSGGQFTLTVDGQTGPDYEVLASTNLVNWDAILTNTSPAMPFTFTDTNSVSYPVRFYRIVVGPPNF